MTRRARACGPLVSRAGVISPTVVLVAAFLGVVVWMPAPAAAQVDFSGEWTPVRAMDSTESPWVGDWVGLPLNDAGLDRAESWDPSLLSLPEYQCRPHGWGYIYRGPTQLRISKEVDPFTREIVAYHPEWNQSTNMPVYLDGRQPPPAEAAHTWGGFSTATWEGDMLRIETTHLKEDYIRRNGAMISDEATITTFWIRRGNYLTWISVVSDPVYLSEPLVRSAEYELNVNSLVPAHPCTSVYEGLEPGNVPHYLPGANPFLAELRRRYGIPEDAPIGGAETMYPEFQRRVGEGEWSRPGRRGRLGVDREAR